MNFPKKQLAKLAEATLYFPETRITHFEGKNIHICVDRGPKYGYTYHYIGPKGGFSECLFAEKKNETSRKKFSSYKETYQYWEHLVK